MKRFSFFCAALFAAVTSFATVTYELNGAVTNDYGWQSKKDMYEALNADWIAYSKNTTKTNTWPDYETVYGVGKSNAGVASQTDANFVTFFQDTLTEKWGWMLSFLDALAADQGKASVSAR